MEAVDTEYTAHGDVFQICKQCGKALREMWKK